MKTLSLKAEERARRMLERMGVDDVLVLKYERFHELTELIRDNDRLREQLAAKTKGEPSDGS